MSNRGPEVLSIRVVLASEKLFLALFGSIWRSLLGFLECVVFRIPLLLRSKHVGNQLGLKMH